MLRILWTSKSAMVANTDKMDAISNNMANVNTEGYKKIDVNFKDLMSESLDKLGYPVSKNTFNKGVNTTGTGVKSTAWVRDNTQGNLITTGTTTDLAVDGEGYYRFTTPNNEKVYSRSGKFEIDGNGKLTDSNGDILDITYSKNFNANNVKLTRDNFSVGENGELSILGKNTTTQVGTIKLYGAVGDNTFKSVGENMFVPDKGATVYEVKNPAIRQGYYENSNVDVASEMTDLIVTQRAYELASKGIKTADDMWGIANNLRSK